MIIDARTVFDTQRSKRWGCCDWTPKCRTVAYSRLHPLNPDAFRCGTAEPAATTYEAVDGDHIVTAQRQYNERDGMIHLSDDGSQHCSVDRAGRQRSRVAVPFADVTALGIGISQDIVIQDPLSRRVPALVVISSCPLIRHGQQVLDDNLAVVLPPTDQDPAELMGRCPDSEGFCINQGPVSNPHCGHVRVGVSRALGVHLPHHSSLTGSTLPRGSPCVRVRVSHPVHLFLPQVSQDPVTDEVARLAGHHRDVAEVSRLATDGTVNAFRFS